MLKIVILFIVDIGMGYGSCKFFVAFLSHSSPKNVPAASEWAAFPLPKPFWGAPAGVRELSETLQVQGFLAAPQAFSLQWPVGGTWEPSSWPPPSSRVPGL